MDELLWYRSEKSSRDVVEEYARRLPSEYPTNRTSLVVELMDAGTYVNEVARTRGEPSGVGVSQWPRERTVVRGWWSEDMYAICVKDGDRAWCVASAGISCIAATDDERSMMS